MSESINFKILLNHEGFDTPEAQEAAAHYLCEEGVIARPDKTNVSVEKIKTIRDKLESHFIKLCNDHVCNTIIIVFSHFKNKKCDFNINNILKVKLKDYCDICYGQSTRKEANKCMSIINNNDVIYNILLVGGVEKQHKEILDCIDNKFVEPNLNFRCLSGSKHTKSLKKQLISVGKWACKNIIWDAKTDKMAHARTKPIMDSKELRRKIIYCDGGIVSVFRELKNNISMGGLFRCQ